MRRLLLILPCLLLLLASCVSSAERLRAIQATDGRTARLLKERCELVAEIERLHKSLDDLRRATDPPRGVASVNTSLPRQCHLQPVVSGRIEVATQRQMEADKGMEELRAKLALVKRIEGELAARLALQRASALHHGAVSAASIAAQEKIREDEAARAEKLSREKAAREAQERAEQKAREEAKTLGQPPANPEEVGEAESPFNVLVSKSSPPSGSGPLLDQYFMKCSAFLRRDSLNEFAFRRCMAAVDAVRKEVRGKTMCSIMPVALGQYDFDRKAFPTTLNGRLGDPWEDHRSDRDEYGEEVFTARRGEVFITNSIPTLSKAGSFMSGAEPIGKEARLWVGVSDVEDAEAMRVGDGAVFVQYIFEVQGPWRLRRYGAQEQWAERIVQQFARELVATGMVARADMARALAEVEMGTVFEGIHGKVKAWRLVWWSGAGVRVLASWPMKPDQARLWKDCPGGGSRQRASRGPEEVFGD